MEEESEEKPKREPFWKARTKHGRDKIFATPEIMWDAAVEYFQWCEDNPFMKAEAKAVSVGNGMGSKIEIIEVPVMRPYTLHGLCLFLHVNTAYFRQFKAGLPENEEHFSTIIKEIEETVYNQKFSGAASGFLKENIIARDLGLTDKKDITTGGEKIATKSVITFPNGSVIDLG